MNLNNQAFKSKMKKAHKAITELLNKGCAVITLTINDNGILIYILPPTKQKLTGQALTVIDHITNRYYVYQTRLHDCTVRWYSSPPPLEQKQYL